MTQNRVPHNYKTLQRPFKGTHPGQATGLWLIPEICRHLLVGSCCSTILTGSLDLPPEEMELWTQNTQKEAGACKLNISVTYTSAFVE